MEASFTHRIDLSLKDDWELKLRGQGSKGMGLGMGLALIEVG